MRAKLLLRSTGCIIQTDVPSAAPRLGMLRNLHRLLAPPSAHIIYYHRTRVRVINYWHQGRRRAHSVPLPTTPAKKRGKSVHYSPHAIWFLVGRWYLRKSKLAFWENLPNGN
jgi:hypothetical protein